MKKQKNGKKEYVIKNGCFEEIRMVWLVGELAVEAEPDL